MGKKNKKQEERAEKGEGKLPKKQLVGLVADRRRRKKKRMTPVTGGNRRETFH